MRMNAPRARLALALGLAVTLFAQADSALAQEVCEPPISTCRTGPIPLDAAASLEGLTARPVPIPPLCPGGYECACVPSCPACDDCAVQVCVRAPEPEPECKTACDCEPGLGCFEGQCIAGFAPVYCCDSDVCPAGNQCQHRDGRMDRCEEVCVDQVWTCDHPGSSDRACGDDRRCSCLASCPFCEDCGGGICVPPRAPTPYKCSDDGTCSQPGDRCICASSCPECDDCAEAVCVPDKCDDPMCEERVKNSTAAIEHLIRRANKCERASDCVRIDTGTECRGTCGAWIHKRYERKVSHRIDEIDMRICDGFIENGCPFATPACLLERPACREGVCVGVPARIEPIDDVRFLRPEEALEATR